MFDLAIIGSGPAALSAAIYAGRAGLKVGVFERLDFGGLLPKIDRIENYPGFLGSGKELGRRMREQAEGTGAKFSYGTCTNVVPTPDGFHLTIDAETVRAKAALIATGSEPRTLGFAIDPPVSYCALCDGPLTHGKHVAVVGGANSAVQEAFFLANLAKDVTIITHSQLKADQALLSRLRDARNLRVQEQVEPTPELLNQFDHVFVYIGKYPATSCLRQLADSLLSESPLLDDRGYVVAGFHEHQYETIVEGLFAAGDVRQGSVKQVVTAAAEGAAAAIELSARLR